MNWLSFAMPPLLQMSPLPECLAETVVRFARPLFAAYHQYDGSNITVFDTGARANALNLADSGVKCLAALGNGLLASGCKDGGIRVWDVASGKCLTTFQEPANESVTSLVALSDGLLLGGHRAWFCVCVG